MGDHLTSHAPRPSRGHARRPPRPPSRRPPPPEAPPPLVVDAPARERVRGPLVERPLDGAPRRRVADQPPVAGPEGEREGGEDVEVVLVGRVDEPGLGREQLDPLGLRADPLAPYSL